MNADILEPVDALEVLKRRRRSGLPESSVMILIAVTGRMRSRDIEAVTEIRGSMLSHALADLRQRDMLTTEGPDCKMVYSRSQKGEEYVEAWFKSSPAFQGNHPHPC